jgi:hypothetical protein
MEENANIYIEIAMIVLPAIVGFPVGYSRRGKFMVGNPYFAALFVPLAFVVTAGKTSTAATVMFVLLSLVGWFSIGNIAGDFIDPNRGADRGRGLPPTKNWRRQSNNKTANSDAADSSEDEDHL